MDKFPGSDFQASTRLQINRNINVATMTLLVIDWLFCFQDEVEYIWKADWTSGKILYLLTRYSAFLDAPITMYRIMTTTLSPDHCTSLYKTAGWMIVAGIIISEVIMTVCIWNLYERNQRIGLFLMGVWVIAIGITVIWYVKFLNALAFVPSDVPGCSTKSSGNLDFVCFSVLVTFETLLLLMTATKAFRYYRTETTSFIDTVLRHWIAYFLSLDLVSASNIILLQTKLQKYENLLVSLQRVLHSIMSARIVLHMRQQAQKQTHVEFDLDSGTVMSNLELESSRIAAGEP